MSISSVSSNSLLGYLQAASSGDSSNLSSNSANIVATLKSSLSQAAASGNTTAATLLSAVTQLSSSSSTTSSSQDTTSLYDAKGLLYQVKGAVLSSNPLLSADGSSSGSVGLNDNMLSLLQGSSSSSSTSSSSASGSSSSSSSTSSLGQQLLALFQSNPTLASALLQSQTSGSTLNTSA